MIKSLKINNYKSWEKCDITFVEGVNVIKGSSHSGKSNLHRAIEWCLLNRPTRDQHSSLYSDSDKVNVRIDFDDGFVERGKQSKDFYLVNENKLTAFRFDVPDEVKCVTRMDDRNILSQHGKFTLLSETPGEVGRIINQFSGLQEANELLKKTNSVLSEHKDTLKRKEEELKEVTEKLETLNELEALEALTTKASDLDEECKKLTNEYEDVLDLKHKEVLGYIEVQELDKRVKDLSQYTNRCDDLQGLVHKETIRLEAVSVLYRHFVVAEKFVASTKDLDEDLKRLQRASKSLDKTLKSLEGSRVLIEERSSILEAISASEDALEVLPLVDKAEILSNDLQSLNKYIQEVLALSDKQTKLLSELSETDQKLIKAQTSLDDIYADLKTCPICERVME